MEIVVALGSKNSTKIQGAKIALRRIFGKKAKVRIVPVAVASGVHAQPFGRQTIQGAKQRAVAAHGKVGGAAYGIGLESGLFEFDGRLFDIAFCAVYDGKTCTLGNSMGFALPSKIEKEVRKGKVEMGKIVARISGIKGIGSKKGAIHFLSGGMMHRREMNEQALCCAFIPRIAKKKGIL